MVCFKEVFGPFLCSKGYKFNKNCYIKFENDVLNCVSVYSRKVIDEVEIDIIHGCTPIDEPYNENLTTDNEDGDFSLGRIACSDGLIDDIYWVSKSLVDFKDTLDKIYQVYIRYFDIYFNAQNPGDLENKEEKYLTLLEKDDEDDLIEKVFVGSAEDKSLIPENSIARKYTDKYIETLFSIRDECFYLCNYINEIVCDNDPVNTFSSDFWYVKKLIDSYSKDIKIMEALIYNDEKYISDLLSEEERNRQRIIEDNKNILIKYGLLT